MADGVAITAGSGTTIATDDVAGVHYQRVKLVNGTLDATDAIGGDATNGLDVDVTRLPSLVAGTAYVGKVRITDGTNDATLSTAFSDGESNTQNTVPAEAYNMVFNGTTWDRQRGDTTNGTWVNVKSSVALAVTDNSGSLTVDNAGTFAVQNSEIGLTQVKGGGTQTGTTDQSIMAAAGVGVFNYLQWVTVYNSSATNTFANVKDGSTVVAVLPLPAYGGCMFMPPKAIKGTANTAWNVAAGAGVTTAYFYGGGYTSSS